MKEIKSKADAGELICPRCGKKAFRRERCGERVAYLHLTKKGTMRHFLEEKT